MLSVVHLLNFLNYTLFREYFNPPLARSILLVGCTLVLLPTASANLRFHFQRSWDMYAICALALLSAAYSADPLATLKYASWLTLAVYVGTELSARVRTRDDVVAALAIVLLPASFLVTVANLALGPRIAGGGRHYGALGSTHVDTAYAMNFICLFLALRALPGEPLRWPRWLRLAMWGALGWACYQAVFGLTRSVWLAVILGGTMYFFRRRLTFKRAAGVIFAALCVVIVLQVAGTDSVLPQAVQDRLRVTEERIESGELDPRVASAQFALAQSVTHPFGSGYAILSSHNSYLNLLLYFGWPGFLLGLVAIARSVAMVMKLGTPWFMFFAIGAAPLLLQAVAEVQSLPGQANFIPLLLWYALSRARIASPTASAPTAPVRRRPNFVGA